jgi:hypothetical protein
LPVLPHNRIFYPKGFWRNQSTKADQKISLAFSEFSSPRKFGIGFYYLSQKVLRRPLNKIVTETSRKTQADRIEGKKIDEQEVLISYSKSLCDCAIFNT